MSSPADSPPSLVPSAARAIIGLIFANSSLLAAVLVYMGWAYEDALYGYFHIRVLDLGVGVVEYVLRSLSLFSVAIVFVAAALIAVSAVRAWGLNLTKFVLPNSWAVAHLPGARWLRGLAVSFDAHQPKTGRAVLIGAGAVMTAAALILAWLASYIPVSTYLVLALLGAGLPMTTWPTRAERRGRFPFALAVVVAAVCALWAGSLYANAVGVGAAKSLVRDLPGRTAVSVYSTEPLALSGPGVTEQGLGSRFLYRYRYEGLRLLIMRDGTYYLLPVDWSPRYDITYVFTDNDQIRVELY